MSMVQRLKEADGMETGGRLCPSGSEKSLGETEDEKIGRSQLFGWRKEQVQRP